MTKKILAKSKELYGSVKKRITPAFLIMLALSLIFWYSGKLQYTYTTSIPITVSIEGERVRATCMVEGTGHNLLAARYFKRRVVKLQRFEVELLPVDSVSNTYEITPTSLQNVLSVRNSNLKILSVSRMPFVVLDEW
ncbi:MAG: hypothetical protein J6U53_04230 [Tidjanibacter sp.]|nr:hypothetical protein [Tidjanibacter sp.]